MKRLWWSLRYGGVSLPVTAAAVLLLAAGLLHGQLIGPALARLAALEHAASVSIGRATAQRPDTPERQLDAFYSQFPRSDVVPAHLSKLFALAQSHGITLQQGEYRLIRDRDARVARYQMVLPVQGPYVKVRRFVSAALFAMPSAALDQIGFERKRLDDGQVDAQLRFTLYLLDS